jgi:hypothetical protein
MGSNQSNNAGRFRLFKELGSRPTGAMIVAPH